MRRASVCDVRLKSCVCVRRTSVCVRAWRASVCGVRLYAARACVRRASVGGARRYTAYCIATCSRRVAVGGFMLTRHLSTVVFLPI